MENKKIAVVGVGGVGGYLAGMIGAAYPGQVTFAARGARAESLRKNGLVLHSELHGEVRATPRAVVETRELKEQDYIFLCVKNYSLEEVCAQMAGAVGAHTLIIPVMNGVDPAQRVRAALGRGIVADAVIYIVAFANEDASIEQQGDFTWMRLGIKDADERQRAALAGASEILTKAGVDHLMTDDIELEVWLKYILNCAYNVASAAYDNSMGQLRDDPEKAREYEALIAEAYEVARAKGVPVLPEHKREFVRRFYEDYRYDATSSLQRDLNAGRPCEIDTFSGYLLREAKRLSVSVPVSEKMFSLLMSRR